MTTTEAVTRAAIARRISDAAARICANIGTPAAEATARAARRAAEAAEATARA
jgi:hypothetical protein